MAERLNKMDRTKNNQMSTSPLRFPLNRITKQRSYAHSGGMKVRPSEMAQTRDMGKLEGVVFVERDRPNESGLRLRATRDPSPLRSSEERTSGVRPGAQSISSEEAIHRFEERMKMKAAQGASTGADKQHQRTRGRATIATDQFVGHLVDEISVSDTLSTLTFEDQHHHQQRMDPPHKEAPKRQRAVSVPMDPPTGRSPPHSPVPKLSSLRTKPSSPSPPAASCSSSYPSLSASSTSTHSRSLPPPNLPVIRMKSANSMLPVFDGPSPSPARLSISSRVRSAGAVSSTSALLQETIQEGPFMNNVGDNSQRKQSQQQDDEESVEEVPTTDEDRPFFRRTSVDVSINRFSSMRSMFQPASPIGIRSTMPAVPSARFEERPEISRNNSLRRDLLASGLNPDLFLNESVETSLMPRSEGTPNHALSNGHSTLPPMRREPRSDTDLQNLNSGEAGTNELDSSLISLMTDEGSTCRQPSQLRGNVGTSRRPSINRRGSLEQDLLAIGHDPNTFFRQSLLAASGIPSENQGSAPRPPPPPPPPSNFTGDYTPFRDSVILQGGLSPLGNHVSQPRSAAPRSSSAEATSADRPSFPREDSLLRDLLASGHNPDEFLRETMADTSAIKNCSSTTLYSTQKSGGREFDGPDQILGQGEDTSLRRNSLIDDIRLFGKDPSEFLRESFQAGNSPPSFYSQSTGGESVREGKHHKDDDTRGVMREESDLSESLRADLLNAGVDPLAFLDESEGDIMDEPSPDENNFFNPTIGDGSYASLMLQRQKKPMETQCRDLHSSGASEQISNRVEAGGASLHGFRDHYLQKRRKQQDAVYRSYCG